MTQARANVALVHLFLAADGEAEARDRLAAMAAAPATRDMAEAMQALWRRNPDAFDMVRRVDAIARRGAAWGAVFDAAAAVDPCTAVALYSLGDPALLAAATGEIVTAMRRWQVIGPEAVVLDFGCGTGRIAAAVAPAVQRVLGVDASPRMVDIARATVAHHANAAIIQAESLAELRGDRFDAVLAIDSSPYLVDSGKAPAMWADAAALLEPGGVFLIMNYSYRGDPGEDAAEVTAFAAIHGFRVLRHGSEEFSLWDGRVFLLRKSQ